MANDDTSIRIKTDTWKRLNDLKQPGVSFDDIIAALLDEHEGENVDWGNSEIAVATATAD